MKRPLICCLLALFSYLDAAQPNIIFVLIDDMGWSGTSVQIAPNVSASKSSIYQTPQLEKLADAGMRFTNAYAPGPMCSPSRAGILTGKTPAEVQMTTPGGGGRTQDYQKLAGGSKDSSLSTDLDTIAKSLKSAGYATAHLGKWHIGRTGPEAYGYDVHDGSTGNEPPDSSSENPKDIFGINQRAFDFMEQQSQSHTPFYLQLSHYAVHSPVEARASSKERFKDVPPRGKNDAAGLAAMTYDIDDSIGQLRAEIEALGIADNTYLIVMSDNGGTGGGPRRGSDGPLNAGKGSLLEGGIRIPFFAEGPGIAAGSISRESITGCDLYPTFCEWAGTTIPTGLEGVSLASHLAGKQTTLTERSHLFHYPHYGQGPKQKPQSALILGDYKVLYDWESQSIQLFNLKDDLGETKDLSKSMPDKTQEMINLLHDRLKAIDASLPTPNPDYDPSAKAPTGRPKR
ncbi:MULTISPECIES: sulfatase [unclassified Lentimonas]|uniref:sulfatase n=1 Tax=unclassified Lentimonas TaxID=2630993 RepID=UPI001329327A|nr:MULTISPECIES: sulfatase [unclassified Lentimonas]CAA6690291.1 Unannotated [Lentimonas sp. CC10]CAA6697701.1 Unannotated [Lentimonas sp. CC19]CAA7069062.1 Unannotated [Lentimonas sp. CC11]